MKAIIICSLERKSKIDKDELEDSGILDTFSDSKCLLKYLKNKVGISKNKIFLFYKNIKRFKAGGLLRRIEDIVSKSCWEPLLICFDGHGIKGEWALFNNDGVFPEPYTFYHKYLVKVLEEQRGPLIIIADCCHAMSLSEYLKKLKCKKLLIGLSPKNKLGFGSVLAQILEEWNSGNVADPLYDNGHREMRYFKIRDYRKSKYCRLYENNKKFRKYYYDYFVKKIRIVLREGDNLDYLMYPKK
mgnify:FL=1